MNLWEHWEHRLEIFNVNLAHSLRNITMWTQLISTHLVPLTMNPTLMQLIRHHLSVVTPLSHCTTANHCPTKPEHWSEFNSPTQFAHLQLSSMSSRDFTWVQLPLVITQFSVTENPLESISMSTLLEHQSFLLLRSKAPPTYRGQVLDGFVPRTVPQYCSLTTAGRGGGGQFLFGCVNTSTVLID